MTSDDALAWNKADGLLPAIVQHAETGEVLMLGYMDRAALVATRQTGRVTFYSRSRGRLWTKGETSGNHLELVDLGADCDHDTILVRARPAGPVCHRGTPTCFDAGLSPPLSVLERTIVARAGADPGSSYTARLLAAGTTKIAQKVGEEGVEVALAGVAQDDAALLGEAADLVYHLLVLLAARGLAFADVERVLAERHALRARGESGR